MHVRYTYGNRHRVGLPYSLDKAPLSNALMNLKGSVVNSEELLRKSLAQMSAPKENLESSLVRKEVHEVTNRKGLRDVTNLQTASEKPKKKAIVQKPTEPLPTIAELPSILSSPLIVNNGKPVINRTPPSERVVTQLQPVMKPERNSVVKPEKKPAMSKKKLKRKQSEVKPFAAPRGLATVDELKFVVRPEDIGNKIWVRRSG